ncbi:MAG TPA: lysine--tRNA ligase [Solirubrobacteraceae bacterium]|jgi:lysyl-tRNA synthetase class 2|nr:lysine--tRNA ligase [Solirubrobacteraceae bacterium]
MSGSDEHRDSPEPGRHGLPELMAERRAKAEQLQETDPSAFPYAFAGAEPIRGILEAYAHLAVGEETEDSHRIAGRIAARRGAGRAAFMDIVDRTGKIQLHARVDVLGKQDFERLLSLDLGDLLGVDGAVLRSKHGELTLRVDAFQVLSKALRPPPDKHHGLTDVETRHRRRELDLIANEETRKLFMDRATIIAAVRGYLDEHGFIEVETPVLQPLYGGALARPFLTHHNELDRDLYLRIATELYLKRLIVGGLERVYEIGKDFRNEGVSTKHNPEFTMVEFYEAYADYNDEAERLEELVRRASRSVEYSGELDFEGPWRRLTFQQAIAEHTGIDVLAHPDVEQLRAAISRQGLEKQITGETWFLLADEVLSKVVEPKLVQPTLVMDYPVELSPLAREHRSQPGLVERWEAFAGGMEIANAFSELIDPDVQRGRFQAQGRLEQTGVPETMPFDEPFIEALEQGMPPAGGVGLGIDRLVMLLTGRRSIREVVLFPAMRD